ncbi:MAG TPA: VIT domain-containing protein [Polyangia bacterium]|jgi:hypothetical protein
MSTSVAPPNQSPLTPSPAPPPAPPELSGFWAVAILLCGVLLPAITILVEALTHLCADVLFDPLPSVAHVFALATVPLASLFSLRALQRRDGAHLDAILFAQAFAAAVSGVYALLFAPVTPLAAVAIAAWGLGFLPLSPLLSCIAGLRALFALRRLRAGLGRPPRRLAWGGFAAGVVALVALNVPALVTRVLLVRAAADDPAVSRSAITWLRRIGERDLLLRAAAGRAHGEMDLVGAALDVVAPIPRDKTREIYFRVTGRPIEDETPPRFGGSPFNLPDRRWDVKQGGDEVGVVALPGLSLASSRFDGSVDAQAALAYVEWTFELRNAAPMAREARAELALPPGGVVSRVTLWIDGVEHEAAFAGRDTTRRAYERVVRARRDPILVTTSAPDRVLVQCFPVQGNGGVMKARIGITAPLQLAGLGAGTLGLPYITQRNFDVPAGVTHAIWIASKSPFAAPAAPLVRGQVADGEEVRGKLAEPATPAPFAAVTVQRPAAATAAWAPERASKDVASRDGIIRQTLQAVTAEPPSRLVIVVDGGSAMKQAGAVVGDVVKALPAGVPLAIEIAGDEVIDLLGGVVRAGEPAADPDHVARALRALDFAGGTDSLPALAAASDLAAAAPRGAVLWIHGPQSMLVAPAEELRQRMERRKDGPIVYTYAAVGGENRLLAGLADLPNFKAAPRYLPGDADLPPFVAELAGRSPRIVALRARAAAARPAALDGVETSDHLARLWAADRIDALLHPASGAPAGPAEQKEALALAAQYHLVTAVSGAVVLDSQAATDAVAGSDAAQANVPTVPEPETWALLGLVALVLALALRARRRMPAGGALAR